MARQRKYLEFNGTTTFIDAGKAAEHKIGKPLTVEAWIYPYRSNDYEGLVAKSPQDGSIGGYALVLGGEDFFARSSAAYITRLSQEGAKSSNTSRDAITPNRWQHVAFVYDGDRTLTLYIDGTVRATASLRQSGQELAYPTDDPLLFGKYWARDPDTGAPVARFFQGKMAEVRLWNVARAQKDIQADYRSRLSGTEAGLVGYWPLDEGQGSEANDRGPNKRTGTITGGSWGSGDNAICDGPQIEVVPNPKDFGSQQVDKSGSAVTFTLSNKGTSDLTLKEKPTLAGTDASSFALDVSATQLQVAPSGSTTFTVAFHPKSASARGAKAAAVEIKSNDPDHKREDQGPYKVALQGTATAAGVTGAYTIRPDDGLYRVDLTNGKTTLVGKFRPGINYNKQYSDIAALNGALYVIGRKGPVRKSSGALIYEADLLRIDPNTAEVMKICQMEDRSANNCPALGQLNLKAFRGTLYGYRQWPIATESRYLADMYVVDPNNGTGQLLWTSAAAPGDRFFMAIDDDGTCYVQKNSSSSITFYEMDLDYGTVKSSRVHATSTGQVNMAAMDAAGGKLYRISAGSLFEVEPRSGSAKRITPPYGSTFTDMVGLTCGEKA